MASILDLLIQSQAGKEVTANALFEAARAAMLFAKRASLCSGLNWFYYGGVMLVDGVLTTIANNSGALALSASSTNYIEATRAGVVSKNTTGFTPGAIPLYIVTTGASSVTGDPTDCRAWVQPEHLFGKASASLASADWTLSSAESRCDYYTATGSIGVNRNVIVPNDWRGTVFNNTTGAFTVTFKTSGGSGVVVATGKRCQLLSDGANVVRISPDV